MTNIETNKQKKKKKNVPHLLQAQEAILSNNSVVSSDQPAQTESPVGRLKDRISQWRLATDSFLYFG